MTPYKITPALIPNELMLTFDDTALLADIQRGAGLAWALSARGTRNPTGWLLTPARMRKWELLFEAGFEAKTQKFDKRPRFGRAPGEMNYLWQAVAIARNGHAGIIGPAANEYFSRHRVEVKA